MLDETTLSELKAKLPFRYANAIITAYYELYEKEISRWTIGRFFKGEMYSQELHNAILHVVSAQQLLGIKTREVINA